MDQVPLPRCSLPMLFPQIRPSFLLRNWVDQFHLHQPNEGETGSSVCTITSLGKGETAFFVGTYKVDAVSNGTTITDTASITTSCGANPEHR